MKTHLDLFSGIGGFALAARWAGLQTIGFCENENYPRRVLAKHWPGVPIHGDVRNLDGSAYKGVDLITGGYPCQPFSLAGQRKGTKDDRHLWPEMLRVIAQARPAWVIAENVSGHITMGLDQVLLDLEGEGYSGRAVVVPACAVDAPHRRDRVWIIAKNVADTGHAGILQRGVNGDGGKDGDQQRGVRRDVLPGRKQGEVLAHASRLHSDGSGEHSKQSERQEPQLGDSCSQDNVAATDSTGCEKKWWLPEPDVGRVAHGVPNRVDRLRGLGNAIVPQVAYQLIMSIQQVEPSAPAN